MKETVNLAVGDVVRIKGVFHDLTIVELSRDSLALCEWHEPGGTVDGSERHTAYFSLDAMTLVKRATDASQP